jgi:ribosomal protein S18 acetylase RimI-like enzyme
VIDVGARRAGRPDERVLAEMDAEARASLVVQRGGPLRLLRELPPFDADLLDDGDAIVVVGTIDDVVIGFAHAVGEKLPDGEELVVLAGLYVDPGAREVGVGEAMMDLVVEWGQARGATGIDAVALPGDRATKNFFERFGLTARAIVVHRSLRP